MYTLYTLQIYSLYDPLCFMVFPIVSRQKNHQRSQCVRVGVGFGLFLRYDDTEYCDRRGQGSLRRLQHRNFGVVQIRAHIHYDIPGYSGQTLNCTLLF